MKNIFSKTIFLALSIFASLFISQFGISEEKTKVGFVYVGSVGDHGWTYEHNQSANYVKEKLGDKVSITYVENVPEGADAERVIQNLAQDGHDIIFATSFGFMNPVLKVAKRFPNVKFEHATGFKRAKNVSTYSARFYEGRYVIGKIAGKMTKSNVIGYIASFPIPEVIRGINSTYLSAKSVNPNIKMKIIWVNTWFDPGKEASAAQALIDQGADIIMQHTDSAAAMTVAENRGVYAFGQASDMAAFGPNVQLTAIIDNWGPYYLQRVKDIMNNTWKSTDTFDGIKEGMVEFAPFLSKIPSDVKNLALKTIDDIKSGKTHPFTGPIDKQDGSQWLADGEVANIKDLIGMNFYVKGIDSKIPQ